MQVEQVDRKAAASAYYAWIGPNPVIPRKMTAGEADGHSMVQAFARHREAARIEGIRLGLEAAAKHLEGEQMLAFDGFHLTGFERSNWSLIANAAAIRAIDPAKIGAT